MSLFERLGITAVIEWWKYRKVDHFELRWREWDGRGWKRVDDPDEIIDPSDIEEPIPRSHFQSHAETMGYYQGEYRLVPIDEKGRLMESVWQIEFYDGPSLAAERRAEQRKQERELEQLKAMNKELEELKEEWLED